MAREQLVDADMHALFAQSGRRGFRAGRSAHRPTRLDTLEHPQLAHALDVLAHLERDAQRLVEVVVAERHSARAQSIVSPTPGSL